MIVSESHRFVFFHVPKTGGTSITKLIVPYSVRKPEQALAVGDFGWHLPFHFGGMHANVGATWHHYGKPEWWDYHWFGFVRNPFDLVVSAWRMNIPYYAAPNQVQHRRFEQANVPVPIENLSLSDFLKYELGHQVFPVIRKTQSEALLTEVPRELDFIGRFESLAEDWEKVAKVIGVSGGIPHENRSQRDPDYRKYYDRETRGLVEEFYREDLENFDYAF